MALLMTSISSLSWGGSRRPVEVDAGVGLRLVRWCEGTAGCRGIATGSATFVSVNGPRMAEDRADRCLALL